MDASRRPTIVGVFDSREQAESAIDALHAAGFTKDHLGIAARGERMADDAIELSDEGLGDRAGAVGGAVTGGIAGGIIGAVLVGLIPGVGPVIAAGTLAGVLGGVVTGAAVGGLVGALMDMGVTEDEARRYEREFRAGRTIVTVMPDGRHDEAMTILRRNGGHDLGTSDTMAVARDSGDLPRDREPVHREPVHPEPRAGEDEEVRLRYRAGPIEVTTTGEDPTAQHGRSEFGEGSVSGVLNVDVDRVEPDEAAHSTARWEDVEPGYRARWLERYGETGEQWERYEPRYRYAWLHRRRPEHAGRTWEDSEPELRQGWREHEQQTPWEEAVDAIRDAWEHRDLEAPIVDESDRDRNAA